MITTLAKKIAGRLPSTYQQELKRLHFRRKIVRGRFVPQEPEMAIIAQHVSKGACVIDVGANIGHYTCHLASCVGPDGRVIALEPMLDAFCLLSANLQAAGFKNVTLLNLAASAKLSEARMSVPRFAESGMENLYRAHLTSEGDIAVLCATVDSLPVQRRIELIKVDAEGHDLEVLMGAEKTLAQHKPMLIVEAQEQGEIADWLRSRGYTITKAEPKSPNIVGRPAT